MPRQPKPGRNDHLRNTPCGSALLDLLDTYPTYAELARKLGIKPRAISQCLIRGRASRNMARLAEEALGIPKEKVRPDISADGWTLGTPGIQPGRKAVRDGKDQLKLLGMTAFFGSVRELCASTGIAVADYHRWMSRNKIPPAALERMLESLPNHLKAQIGND